MVGAPGNASWGSAYGAVYLYQSNADGSVWTYRQKLVSPAPAPSEFFGGSVALSGSTIVIGAYGSAAYTGRAYAYRWNGSTWAHTQTLSAPNAATYDYFGYAVGASGNVIVVGAYGADIAGVGFSGSAYVFRSPDNGATWANTQILVPPDSAMGDGFGGSVAIDANVAVIGATGDDNGAGSASVFRDNGTAFQWEAKLAASDRATNNLFGTRVAIDGAQILVGDMNWRNLANYSIQQGKVYLFIDDGTTWREALSLLQPSPYGADKDYFGSAVALDGGRAVVGAPGENPPVASDSGKVYFFDITCTTTAPQCSTSTDCNDANICTTDSCISGTCQHTNNTLACNDALYCNGADTCSAGACSIHAGNPCPGADGDLDCSETCNETVDACTANDPNGSICNDGNANTTGDKCSAGLCSGTAITCNDNNPCTTDSVVNGVCVYANNTNSCSDGNACTVGDVCSAGACVASPMNCDDGNGSTVDSCSAGVCQHVSVCATDTTLPTVSLTAPLAGATVSGAAVSISATASDNCGIARVEFYRDGTVLLGADSTAPYAITWNSTTVADGSTHTLSARAYDTASTPNATTSAAISVRISNPVTDAAPSTSITSPLTGSYVGIKTLVTISATASDDHAVTRVEFYINDALVGTDTIAPYTYTWRVPRQRGRTYRLQTRAYDAIPGHAGASAYVTVMSR